MSAFVKALSLLIVGSAPSLATATATVVGPSVFGSASTQVTFETGSTALPLVQGLNFVSSGPSSTTWFSASGNFSGFFGAQGASNLVSSTYSDIAVTFTAPQGIVGAWLGNIPNFTSSSVSTLTVEVFNAQSVSLGNFQVAIPTEVNTSVFFGLSSSEGISRMEWRGENAGFFGLDNLTFQAQPIPEPQTGLLLLTGLASFALLRRRTFALAGSAA